MKNKCTALRFALFLVMAILMPLSLCADSTDVQSLMQEHFPQSTLGLHIERLDGDKMAYGAHPDRLLVPASVLKTFTSLMALKILGKEYQFETLVAHDQGKLYLKFSGDPSLNVKNLEKLLRAYKAKKGSLPKTIVLDTDAFRFPQHAPTWMLEDTQFCYGAPVRGANIQENKVRYTINPTKLQKKTRVSSDSNPTKFMLKNAAMTCRCPKGDDRKECELDRTDFTHGTEVFGCLDRHKTDLRLCFPLVDHGPVFENILKDLVAKIGGARNAKILKGSIPLSAEIVSVHKSAPVLELLRPIMVNSDNLYTDSLFLKAALKLNPKIDKWEEAAAEIIKYAKGAYPELQIEQSRISDGSGLSRNQLVTPRFLTAVMKAARNDPEIKAAFIRYMLSSRGKGWLSKRFRNLKGTLQAKTGSHSGIITLAGYYQSPQGTPYVFSAMINNFVADLKEKFADFDQILMAALEKLP